MYDEYRNVEGANDDLDNALKGKLKPKQEVKSRKTFLAAYCNLVGFETEDLFSEMPEVKELRNRSRDSLHAIEDMISKATTNEMEREREEKNRLKAEKHESDPSLKAKRTILCKDSITQKEKNAMSWSLAIDGKKTVKSLCSWVALTPELVARDIIFHTYGQTNKMDVTIHMQAAKKLLKEHEDCFNGYILLKGNYDIEDVQEVQVVLNEDSEALLDNEEIGDKEMGEALLDNEDYGDEQIVNE